MIFLYFIFIILIDVIKLIIYIYEFRCIVFFVRKGYIYFFILDVKIINSKINFNYLYLFLVCFILFCKYYIICIGYMFLWRKMYLV